MATRNRGKQPNDDKDFAPKWWPVFTEAANDFTYLLDRGYADNSILQIVGNRYKLNKRQRSALLRIRASTKQIQERRQSQVSASSLKGQDIAIDGFNLLILLEAALSGAYIFRCRDGCYRDISSVHGSYKRVQKTEEVILLVGHTLKALEVQSVHWYFDQPVSNSGRLKTRLLEISAEHAFNWEISLVYDPDKVLAQSSNIVVSADGWVIDEALQWFNLGALILEETPLEVNFIDVCSPL